MRFSNITSVLDYFLKTHVLTGRYRHWELLFFQRVVFIVSNVKVTIPSNFIGVFKKFSE